MARAVVATVADCLAVMVAAAVPTAVVSPSMNVKHATAAADSLPGDDDAGAVVVERLDAQSYPHPRLNVRPLNVRPLNVHPHRVHPHRVHPHQTPVAVVRLLMAADVAAAADCCRESSQVTNVADPTFADVSNPRIPAVVQHVPSVNAVLELAVVVVASQQIRAVVIHVRSVNAALELAVIAANQQTPAVAPRHPNVNVGLELVAAVAGNQQTPAVAIRVQNVNAGLVLAAAGAGNQQTPAVATRVQNVNVGPGRVVAVAKPQTPAAVAHLRQWSRKLLHAETAAKPTALL